MFNLIINKIKDFFFLRQEKNIEVQSESVPSFDLQKEVIDKPTIEDLLEDLGELIEMGEYERVIFLSRKYNFYNAYGILLVALIEEDKYELAQEVVLDLITGPFFHKVIIDLESQKFNDIFSIARILYILKLTKEKLYSQDVDPLVRMYIDIFNKTLPFKRFIKKINLISDEKSLFDELLRYSQALEKKIKIYFKKNPKQYLYTEDFGVTEYSKEREYKLYIILEIFYVDKIENRKINNEIVALALNNISDYVYNESSKKYRDTVAKIDLQTIYNAVDILEYLELSKKIGVYDIHTKLALEYYYKNEYTNTLKILQELYENSSLFEEANSFSMQRYKEILEKFILHILSNLNEKERNEFQVFASILDKDKYTLLIDKIIREDEVVECEELKELKSLTDHIYNNSKILITQK